VEIMSIDKSQGLENECILLALYTKNKTSILLNRYDEELEKSQRGLYKS